MVRNPAHSGGRLRQIGSEPGVQGKITLKQAFGPQKCKTGSTGTAHLVGTDFEPPDVEMKMSHEAVKSPKNIAWNVQNGPKGKKNYINPRFRRV